MIRFSQLIWKTSVQVYAKKVLSPQYISDKSISKRISSTLFSSKKKKSKSKRASRKKNPLGQDRKPNRNFQQITSSEIDAMMAADSSGKETGISFTFMSYNILAQDLLEAHPYLYRGCNPNHLDWKFRLGRLAEEILPLRPEVLCLQEVQQNHIPDILKALKKLNFDYVYKKKTGYKTDGCAILYNRDVFDLLEKHTVEYYQPNVKYLDRENVGLIAKLCIKGQPSACLIASTTHLLYNPRRQDVRLAQIKLLLAELDHVSFKEFNADGEIKRYPIILSGDFNLKPHTAPYNLITQGNLVYHNLTQRTLESPSDSFTPLTGADFLPRHLGITDHCQHLDVVKNAYKGTARIQNTDKNRLLNEDPLVNDTDKIGQNDENRYLFSTGQLMHFLNLTSVYNDDKKETATTFQEGWVTVDYIFYSQYFSPSLKSEYAGLLKLLARYSLPSPKQLYEMGLVIPNAHLGSDHLLLAAKFYLEGPKKSKGNGK